MATAELPAWFEDSATAAGIKVIHDSGHRSRYYFPESVCGGGGLLDIDNDGWLDVYVIQCGHIADPPHRRPRNRLYRNLGNGAFEDVTEQSGTGDQGWGMGLATGDYDNDGDTDLYLTNYRSNVLYQNDGTGRFTNVTAQAGVEHDGFGSAAAFFDYDADGNLDLFLVNYLYWSLDNEAFCTAPDGGEDYCSPQTFDAPTVDVLYRNNGDGTFTDVTGEAGIDGYPGNGLGIVCGDFNNDLLPDVYIANDASRNRLWINSGSGRFEDQAMVRGCAIDDEGREKAGMGVHAVDIDDDSDLDLLVANLVMETDSFFRNEGEYFSDFTAALGLSVISRKFTRFGMALLDFDNDGRLDLYEANGNITRLPPYYSDDPYAQPNVLWRGTADGRFEEVRPRGGTAEPLVHASRAAAFGDIDNDGGIDILVINKDAQPYLLKNVVRNRGHWIMLRALEEHGRDALGATITITLADRTIRRDVRTASSYLAANDPRVHFGLAAHHSVDQVSVLWPGGTTESFGSFTADQIVTLRRGQGSSQGAP